MGREQDLQFLVDDVVVGALRVPEQHHRHFAPFELAFDRRLPGRNPTGRDLVRRGVTTCFVVTVALAPAAPCLVTTVVLVCAAPCFVATVVLDEVTLAPWLGGFSR